MANKKEYLEFVSGWLAPLGEISARSMMGGHVLYCDGVVFALVSHNALYLKAGDETRGRFEALGLAAFQPFPDKPGTMPYYLPPAEFFEDSEVMEEWGRQAVEAGRRAQARRKPKAARKTRPAGKSK